MKKYFSLLLLVVLLASPIAGAAEKPASQSLFHPPQTEAEKALNALLERDRKGDGNMYEYILGRPWYDAEKDPGYNRWMTQAFVDSVRTEEKKIVQEDCNGRYHEGEICGIDFHLPVCGQDMTDIGFFFQTTREMATEAYISYVWAEHLNQAVLQEEPDFKMVKQNGVWKLDGLNCSRGYTFNMQ